MVVYKPVPRGEVIDVLVHIRELHGRIEHSNERDIRAGERREAIVRDLVSNLPRTNEHPTLKTLLDVAESCCLTLDGAHKLFGYSLAALRDYDLRLNGGRTPLWSLMHSSATSWWTYHRALPRAKRSGLMLHCEI